MRIGKYIVRFNASGILTVLMAIAAVMRLTGWGC